MNLSAKRLGDWLNDPRRPAWVMGILNATPDSFSDGGQWIDPARAADHAGQMLADGASIIDVGGESTRPGSLPVPAAEQIARVVPVIERICGAFPDAIVSIDTTLASVAEAALSAGAAMVNDISAGRADAAMLPLAAARRVPIVLMHMQGTPATMQNRPTYADVTAEVHAFLMDRVTAALAAGVEQGQIVIDPGIGFGKTPEHNVQLLADLPVLVKSGLPVLVGASRKGFIGPITGETHAADRRFGTAAITAWAVTNGAALLRVHDVADNVRVVKMIKEIQKVEGRRMKTVG